MKKAHIFTLDVVIAITIMLIGIAMIFYSFPVKSETYYFTEQLSEDIITVLVETNINDLCVNPGVEGTTCDCPEYSTLEKLVCRDDLSDTNSNLLSIFTELIEKGVIPGNDIKDVIQDLFVDHKVIDEKRFGFAIIYTTPADSIPKQLYNTEGP